MSQKQPVLTLFQEKKKTKKVSSAIASLPMAGFAGDDPFGFGYDFGDDGDNDPFCYDPFEDYGGEGDEGEGLIGGPFALDYGDGGEYCISGFAFRDGDDDGGDVLVEDGHAPLSSHDEPILETLGRSFDSDGGLNQFYPHLVSALELVEDTSGEEEEEGAMISGNARGGGGSEFERGAVVEEAADDDDGGVGLMLGGLTLDPRPVVGGFQGLVDAVEEATSDDDMGEVGHVGGLMLSGFDLVGPRVVTRPFRMVVGGEDTDSDDADWNLVDALAGRVGEAARRLPASRAVVDGLPEVALSDEEASHGCAVCKDGVAAGQSVLRLPCKHYFHGECIRPWLAIRNTCPVCRFELPTGDADHDWRQSRTGVVSLAQQSAPAQVCYWPLFWCENIGLNPAI